MPTVKGWTAAQRSSLRSTVHQRSPASFVPRITSNATITRNVMVKCSRKHSTQAGHGCESPCALREHQSHKSTSVKSFRRGVASVQTVQWTHQAEGFKHAEPLTCGGMWVAMSCGGTRSQESLTVELDATRCVSGARGRGEPQSEAVKDHHFGSGVGARRGKRNHSMGLGTVWRLTRRIWTNTGTAGLLGVQAKSSGQTKERDRGTVLRRP